MCARTLGLVLSVLALAATNADAAEPKPGFYRDEQGGFSITIPPLGNFSDAVLVQRLFVAGAATGGVAPSCNVQLQFASMTLDVFAEFSARQFKQMGMTVVSTEKRKVSDAAAIMIEYFGKMNGVDLSSRALAVDGGDRIFVLTCSAKTESFETFRPAFEAAMSSFTLIR